MLDIVYLGKMKKDMKACQKRHYDFSLFKDVVDVLRVPDTLSQKHRPHPLTGQYAGYDECHITSDWLLIYKQTETELLLVRTGTHSDLFR